MAIKVHDNAGNFVGTIERGEWAKPTAPPLDARIRAVLCGWLRAGRVVVFAGERQTCSGIRFHMTHRHPFFTVDGVPHDAFGREMTEAEVCCVDCGHRCAGEVWPVCRPCRQKRALKSAEASLLRKFERKACKPGADVAALREQMNSEWRAVKARLLEGSAS
jgi:hypothetical protein